MVKLIVSVNWSILSEGTLKKKKRSPYLYEYVFYNLKNIDFVFF